MIGAMDRNMSVETRNTLDEYGQTALHRACWSRSKSSINELMACPETDVNVRDCDGDTPLHYLAISGAISYIDHDAMGRCETNMRNAKGETPLHSVFDASDVVWLIQHGADPFLEDIFGRTPLHSAARKGHTSVIRALLKENMGLMDICDNAGFSPVALAARNCQLGSIDCIQSLGGNTLDCEDALDLTRLVDLCRNLPYSLMEAGVSEYGTVQYDITLKKVGGYFYGPYLKVIVPEDAVEYDDCIVIKVMKDRDGLPVTHDNITEVIHVKASEDFDRFIFVFLPYLTTMSFHTSSVHVWFKSDKGGKWTYVERGVNVENVKFILVENSVYIGLKTSASFCVEIQ